MWPRFTIPLLFVVLLCATIRSNASGQIAAPKDIGIPVTDLEPFGDLTAHYRVVHWTVEQGLPQNHATCLLQTHDGYIWIGTVFGLVRYDGVRFSVFEKASLGLLEDTDDHVVAMAEDENLALWVCMKNGLLRCQDHQWKTLRAGKEDDLGKTNQPTGLCLARSGGVWVGLKGKVRRYTEAGVREELLIPNASSIRKLIEDDEGNLWLADRYQVLRRNMKTGKVDLIKEGMTAREDWVHFLTRDLKGRICFGGAHGCFRMEDGKPVLCAGWTRTAKGIKTQNIYAYTQDREGRTWLGSNDGLEQVIESTDGSEPRSLGFHQNPGLHDVQELMLDREGNLWAGTVYDGLFYVQERRFGTLRTTQDIKKRGQNEIWTVCEDKEGGIWFGTGQDLFRWKTNSLVQYPPPPPHDHGQIFSVWPDPAGYLWVGYAGYGLFKLRNGVWEDGPLVNPRKEANPQFNIRALYKDRANTLWFGCWHGLHHYRDGNLSQFTTAEGLPSNDVRSILEDREGALWVGTYDAGLSILRNGTFSNYSKSNGLGDNNVKCFLEDADGSVWIGTEVGLTRYRNGRFSTLTRASGLHDNVVNQILQDGSSHFWISCNRGIYRIPRKDANDVLDGKRDRLASQPFGEADGLLSAETNGGSQPAGWRGDDGLLWFPCAVGLVRIDPERVPLRHIAPKVVVEQVIANREIRFGDGMHDTRPQTIRTKEGDYRDLSDNRGKDLALQFGPGEARVLEIRYTANTFEEPGRVRFQYMLEGHDRDWVPADDRRVTHYTNLKPGDYRFRIRASTSPVEWGPEGQALKLKLEPFFYETPWFYVLCGLAAILIAAGVQSYRLYLQRHILQLEKQHALERERARIAKDMHDDLGARLTQLGMISELAEAPGVRQRHRTGSRASKGVTAVTRCRPKPRRNRVGGHARQELAGSAGRISRSVRSGPHLTLRAPLRAPDAGAYPTSPDDHGAPPQCVPGGQGGPE